MRTFAGKMNNGDFTMTLLRWFRDNGRELPWRTTTDPYAVWLSEIILQQTRISQGREYWERFMRRWPTVEQLAAATEDEVLREWQGLGYYSRARNLHTAARQIVASGGFPTTLEGLRALKGVGDYTAAAIGSIAFGLPAAVVDGNVYRVLSRHFGIETPINTTEGKHEFTSLAQALLPADRAADYNQALMDFGALQCTPQSPHCATCPLQPTCDAFRTGRTAQLPVKLKTLTVKERRLTSPALGVERLDYPNEDPEELKNYLTLRQENGEVKFERLPIRFWGNMKEQYEAHNQDYTGVWKPET